MASSAVPSGPIAERVAENVAHWRRTRKLQQRDLSERLREVGRPMLATVVSKIERGERRIDVDDLIALALALDVSPLALLLPRGDRDARVALTATVEVPSIEAWQWADGERSLMPSGDDRAGQTLRFRQDSRPEFDQDPLRRVYNELLAKSVEDAALIGRHGHTEYDRSSRTLKLFDEAGRPIGERKIEIPSEDPDQ